MLVLLCSFVVGVNFGSFMGSSFFEIQTSSLKGLRASELLQKDDFGGFYLNTQTNKEKQGVIQRNI